MLWRYFTLRYYIYLETNKTIQFLQRSQPNSHSLPESIYLPSKVSAKVHFEMKRINHSLDLLFSDTKLELIGPTKQDDTKASTLAKIMQFTKYVPESTKQESKQKKREKTKKQLSNTKLYEVKLPCRAPIIKIAQDRSTLQRLVEKLTKLD